MVFLIVAAVACFVCRRKSSEKAQSKDISFQNDMYVFSNVDMDTSNQAQHYDEMPMRRYDVAGPEHPTYSHPVAEDFTQCIFISFSYHIYLYLIFKFLTYFFFGDFFCSCENLEDDVAPKDRKVTF